MPVKPPPKVRLHIVLSPGAASRLKTLAAAEGTDVSGMVEFLVRSSKRKVGEPRVAPLPPGPPEPEEEPEAPVVERFTEFMERRPFPELSDRTLRVPPRVPPTLPDLRDPTSEDAPETIRHLARLLAVPNGGITAAGKAALKAWMLGDDDAYVAAYEATPVEEVRPTSAGDTLEALGIKGTDQEAVLEAAQLKSTDTLSGAPPAPVPPDTPPKPLRDYSNPDAPGWIREIVGALADGIDALVSEEAMEAIRAWRRGEDVSEPDLSGLREKE